MYYNYYYYIQQVLQFHTNSRLNYSFLFTEYLLNKFTRKPSKLKDAQFTLSLLLLTEVYLLHIIVTVVICCS